MGPHRSPPRPRRTLAGLAALTLASGALGQVFQSKAEAPSTAPPERVEAPRATRGRGRGEEAAREPGADTGAPRRPAEPRATHGKPGRATKSKAVANDPLARFRAALNKAREQGTKSHVVFFGDSHTAADFMSGRVRERLQAEYGDGGPGFVITGQPWRFYRHSRAELLAASGLQSTFVRKRPSAESVPLGLAGVASTNLSPAEGQPTEPPQLRLRLQGAAQPSGRATHFELYYLKQPGGAPLELSLDGKALAPIATQAEQSEPGYFAFDAPDDGAHELGLRAAGPGRLTLFGVVAELEGAGVVVDTLGVPGARARAQLYWDQALLREHLQRRNPELWVLAYGTNESTDVTQPIADYAGQLRQVVSQLRALLPEASCLQIGPTDYPERVRKGVYQPRERTAQINQLQRSTAADFGCGFVDLVEAMGGPLAMLRWYRADPPLGGKDLVHFTRRGYALLGDRIADALLGLPSSGRITVQLGPLSEKRRSKD
jgi:lysophospholipase L1-like esterase